MRTLRKAAHARTLGAFGLAAASLLAATACGPSDDEAGATPPPKSPTSFPSLAQPSGSASAPSSAKPSVPSSVKPAASSPAPGRFDRSGEEFAE
ncbi:hypothetical protein [Streptomyces sp. NPDC051577]|uniref:hypothetical protein n=1 Tax=Streptomyces sp. NPDC051577 TaxID=3155166 RepID=UPI003419DA40